jgi:response regulator RpfG family c-di-GMP phosphodiesterase
LCPSLAFQAFIRAANCGARRSYEEIREMNAESTKQDKPSILLVDDEPEILFSLKGLLRREFNLYTAESGRQALEILQEHPIDVIMTDQRMPEMTGIELMGKVKTKYPHAIRIVFTGYADIRAVIDAINNGGLFRYITKPWDPDDLIEVLNEAVDAHNRMISEKNVISDAECLIRDMQQLALKHSGNDWQSIATRADSILPKLNELLPSKPSST